MILKNEVKHPKCSVCGKPAVIFRDGRFLCKKHENLTFKVESYDKKNGIRKYRKRRGERTISFEFETARTPVESWELETKGFLPTLDGSIEGIEWKSPIVPFSKIHYLLRTIERIEKKTGSLLDSYCGTHIHIGLAPEEIRILQKYPGIFNELRRHLKESDDTERIWGRRNSNWARLDTTYYEHGAFLNLYTSTGRTIEWRLPKWRNRKQFLNIIKIVVKLTEYALYLVREQIIPERISVNDGAMLLTNYYVILTKNPNTGFPKIKYIPSGIILKEEL